MFAFACEKHIILLSHSTKMPTCIFTTTFNKLIPVIFFTLIQKYYHCITPILPNLFIHKRFATQLSYPFNLILIHPHSRSFHYYSHLYLLAIYHSRTFFTINYIITKIPKLYSVKQFVHFQKLLMARFYSHISLSTIQTVLSNL